MKRKITWEFLGVVLLSVILFVLGAFLIAKKNMNDITELNLKQYLEIVLIDYQEQDDPVVVVEKYEDLSDYLRITFMAPNGDVIVDSIAEELENHLDRPEFNNLGTAYIRYSATLGEEMMYIASELDDGNFVRVAIPTSSILPFINDFVGISILIGIVIVIVTGLISGALVRNAMNPLYDVRAILRDVNKGNYKEMLSQNKEKEINELVEEINEINHLIAGNISSLKSEKDKNDFLLNQMSQGICVLDSEGLILMINDYLKKLYKFNIDININKDFRFLFRDQEIQEAITKSLDQQINTNLVTSIREEYYSVSITYLDKNWLNQPSVFLLFSDITAIKNMENMKKDLFDNASHELKSPLTAIIGSSDLILEGMAKDDKTILDLIRRISEEAKRMNNLVMDMLTLSKYENNTEIVRRQNIDINKVTHDVAASLADLAKEKNIEIEVSNHEDYINADYDQMFQLVKNLMENSIKYGKNSGYVKTEIKRENHQLVISVKDNGIGIPKSDQVRIFERFYRVDKARSKSTGGTGLGLSIVKHIVLNYGGHIELDSTEDKGTTILVFIPEKQIKIS